MNGCKVTEAYYEGLQPRLDSCQIVLALSGFTWTSMLERRNPAIMTTLHCNARGYRTQESFIDTTGAVLSRNAVSLHGIPFSNQDNVAKRTDFKLASYCVIN
jgi:hypothetical protein